MSAKDIPSLQCILQRNGDKIKRMENMIENGSKLHQELQEAIKCLTELLQTILIERVNNQFARYIKIMQDTKNMWKKQNDELLPLTELKQDETNKNIINDGIVQSKKKINELLANQSDHDHEYFDELDAEYYSNNILMKSFIQKLFAIIYKMEIYLQSTPSIVLVQIANINDETSHVDKQEDNNNNNKNEDEKKDKKEFEYYGLAILSHGVQFIDEIEKDLKKYDINIDEKMECAADEIEWDEYGINIFENDLSSTMQSLIEVNLEQTVEKMVHTNLSKENETVIVWKLSFDTKYKYRYNMQCIIGPFLIGNMNQKYFPQSLNAKYLKYYEMITAAYISDIYSSSIRNRQNTPNAIIELIEKFYKTTTDNYPFGCLVMQN